jgi:hypothetical protein
MCVLVAVLAALPARAQETRGNINGVVRDKDGVIPAARPCESRTLTPVRRSCSPPTAAATSKPSSQSGHYQVRVEMQGYKTYNQTGISLAVGQSP